MTTYKKDNLIKLRNYLLGNEAALDPHFTLKSHVTVDGVELDIFDLAKYTTLKVGDKLGPEAMAIFSGVPALQSNLNIVSDSSGGWIEYIREKFIHTEDDSVEDTVEYCFLFHCAWPECINEFIGRLSLAIECEEVPSIDFKKSYANNVPQPHSEFYRAKIRLTSAEESKRFQTRVLNDGGSWKGGLIGINHLNAKYIRVDNKLTMSTIDCEDIFELCPYTDISDTLYSPGELLEEVIRLQGELKAAMARLNRNLECKNLKVDRKAG